MPPSLCPLITDFKAYLESKGSVLGADQSAKTKTSLEYFSARLKEKGMASGAAAQRVGWDSAAGSSIACSPCGMSGGQT
jgi:hypothetical protein